MTTRVWRVVYKHHAPAAFFGRRFLTSWRLPWLAVFWAGQAFAIPPNTPITNTASATYRVAGADFSVSASQTIVTDPASGNSPPSGVVLAPNRVDENSPGAAVGVLTVSDPDPADAFTFLVSDPRFEVVGGQLRLIAGTALDFETEPIVPVVIVATDSSGASVTANLVIVVVNVNEPPTALALSKTTVDAGVAGAPVGALTTADPDAGDVFSYAVDDPRFEVVGGTLKLLGGVSLPLGTTVSVVATTTDSGGLGLSATFIITTTPPGSGAGVAAGIRFLELGSGAAGAESIDVGVTSCSASANGSGPFQNLPPPTALAGAPVVVPGTVQLRSSTVFKTGAPVFVEVVDADANVDPLARETVLVSLTTNSGDAELLRLTEDAADSGRFVGYVDSTTGAIAHDCAIGAGLNVRLTADYADAIDPNDRAQARAAFDPISRVFFAATGQPISGVSITLVDTSGVPARVFGDDGTSAYPATVTSGVGVADASGALYVYAPGQYRFPSVDAGTYQLRVTPPHRFTFPSTVPDTALRTLAGAPYALSGASRGGLYTIAGAASQVDVPLDLLPVVPTAATLDIFALGTSGSAVTNPYIGATQCASGAGFVAAPAPVSRSGPVTVPGAVALTASTVFGGGEPVFIVLTDPDQDLDPFAPDTVTVTARSLTGDTQTLILIEDKPSTGVFSGYLQLSRAAAVNNDCKLSVAAGVRFSIGYADAHDVADAVSRSAVVDPGSRVFSSATSGGVDGVTVTLLDAATGQPAANAVYADDGVTPFPTTVVSGDGATDAAGTRIDFASGTFRFPVVVPGTYRYRVAPPVNFIFPSLVTDPQLQTLAGAPFVLGAGSRGADFSVGAAGPLLLEVPLDPVQVDVFVTKQTNKDVAAVGDFVQYHVIVQNADAAGIVTSGALIDELPNGFRYVEDSVRFNGVRSKNPTIARDGRTLRFVLPTVMAASKVDVSYVTQISSGAQLGEARNAAHVVGVGVGSSNTAVASVTVREDLLASKAIVIGQVIDGACDDGRGGALGGAGLADAGLAGVRVLLEDGTYVVTDASGKYHIEGIEPGTHVVQVDVASLPETYEMIACAGDTRHAGTPFSQFVDVQGGTLWRADFHVAKKPPLSSPVSLRLDASLQGGVQARRANFELVLSGGAIALSGITAVVTLPDGLRYVAGSARLDADPIVAGGDADAGALTFRLGDTVAAFTHTLTFAADVVADAPATAKALAMFEVDGKRLRTPVVSTTVDPREAAPPVAADDAGNMTIVEVTAKRTLTARRPFEIPALVDAKPPTFDEAWLATQASQPAIVWPLPDANPRIPAVWIVVKHLRDQRVALTVAGAPVDGLSFDGTEVDRARGVAVTRFRNVPIYEGNNTIIARLVAADGAVQATLESRVHYSGAPVRAEFVPGRSYLIGDGITPSVVAVRLLDRDGAPARPGMTGAFDVRPPFRVLAPPRVFGQALTPQSDHDVYVVHDDGVAYVELEPTTDSGNVELAFEFDGYRSETIKARIAQSTRDWVLVGFGEGTFGYNDVSGNMEALRASDIDKDVAVDGRTAFYAKGRVRGEWLLTLAYDSESAHDDGQQNGGHGQHSLGQQIDPNKYYTLYGDGAQQRYDAQTQSKLYVRLERPDFFALFGDFDTGFNTAELTRYTRRLNGALGEYYGDRVRLQGFAAQTDQGFVRDDLRGDGTSGEYQLSNRGIVVNSDTLHIEVRDRFKSEVVLTQQTLTRYLDYTIDYARGTLLFKQPLPYQDALFNPVYIVAEYEIGGAGASEEIVAGGRAAYRIGTGNSEVGVSYVHDGAPSVGGDLGGVDVRVELPLESVLTLEGATTDTNRNGTANAYVAQLEHHSGDLAGRAYLREQQENFGLGQQAATEAGTRKFGAEGEYRITEALSARLDAFEQTYLVADSQRQVAESLLVFEHGALQLDGGLRAVREETVDRISRDANQMTLGATQTLDGGRLKLHTIADLDLGGGDNIDYPTRVLTGAEYQVASGISILGEQEFTFGDIRDTQNSHIGIKAQPWTGSNVNAAVGRRQGENGERLYATTGLVQAWQVDERWRVDFGMDRVKTLAHDPIAGFPDALTYNPNVPLTSGSIDDDFSAAFVGFGYRQGDWETTTRLEYHYGDQVDKWNLLAGASRQLDDGKVVSASFALLESQQSNGATLNQGDLRVGAAWRPLESDWAFLNRLDLVFNQNHDATFDTTTHKLIENMNANYAPGRRWQLALQLGLKWALDDIDGEEYFGATTLTGLEYRYNLTPRWDVGVRGSALHSFGADTTRYSTGGSVGYNPYKNAWVSVGYNVTGFEDHDFAGSDYTAQGPYLKIRFKVDQESVREFLDYASFRSATDARL